MVDVFNAIRPGFAFSQDFEPEPVPPDGAELWINLRKVTRPPKPPLLSAVFLTRISTTVFRLALTAEQTALFSEGAVEGDFIQRIGGVDLPYGLRLTVAVSDVIR